MKINHFSNGYSILLSMSICLGIYLFIEQIEIDLTIQKYLFNFNEKLWIVDQSSFWPRIIFYDFTRIIVGGVGIYYLLSFITTFLKRNSNSDKKSIYLKRFQALYVVVCIITIPLFVSSLKFVTNTYCPWDLRYYGGKAPYIKLWEGYPRKFHQTERPKCFPGGHASGGFALLSLFFALDDKKRFWGLGSALVLGSVMGGYQMMKGAHFFSHNLATFFISWCLCLIIYRIFIFASNQKQVCFFIK